MPVYIFRIFIVICLHSFTTVNTARILAIFPYTGSHFRFNYAIIRSLYNAGHQITIISSFATLTDMPNAIIVDSRTEKTEEFKNNLGIFQCRKTSTPWYNIKYFRTLGIQYCHEVFSLKEIQEILNSEVKLYDVLIIQLLSMYDCYLPLVQKHNIPVIGTAPTRAWRLPNSAVGNPLNVAELRYGYSDRYEYSQSWNFRDRFINFNTMLQFDIFDYFFSPFLTERTYQQDYGLDFQPEKKVSLLFINNHVSLLSTPLVPNAIEIGGIHVNPANPPTSTITKFLDDAKNGVIVFSLGSLARGSSLSKEMQTVIMNVFSQIPQRIIWKFEEPLATVPSNVLLMKWLPQRDILEISGSGSGLENNLAHKNIKALITHCGISGTFEAIYEAIPMILMPLCFDQASNAVILEKLGVGVYVDLFSITAEKMLSALNAVINDTRYASNMQSLSQKFKDRPMTPQESVVYWTEYVIRHNDSAHLRTLGADMPLYQYLILDIVAFIGILVTGVYLFIRLTKKLCHFRFSDLKID